MSYKAMKDEENFSVSIIKDQVDISFKRTKRLADFEMIFVDWVKGNGYDFNKIKKITALIYLNMSPLHEKEFGDLLYYRSKQLLEECYG